MSDDSGNDAPLAGESIQRSLPDEQATLSLGADLGAHLEPGDSLFLYGDLGAGKTTLVRGLLRALGWTGRVKSPTYSLVEHYLISRLHLYHFDFYRFERPSEWLDAGFHEHFNTHSVCLVEWPERVGVALGKPDLEIRFAIHPDSRTVTVRAHSARGRAQLAALPPRSR